MRAESVAGVRPGLLRWARESANMTVADVAQKLKKPTNIVEAWERGEATPSYPQLEKLAYDLYKRPIAIFFLPSPPDEPKTKAEFRSLPEHDLSTLNRDTIFLIRKARAFQYALDELFGGHSPAERPIWRTVELSVSRPVAAQAARVREELGVSLDQQKECKDEDDALKNWRRVIEDHGVFVFKNTFKQGEISGFCLQHAEFPVIMVNNSTTKTRQVFSVLHEFMHILLHRSAISTFDESRIEELPMQDRRIERFCNAMAAEILVPIADFRAQVAQWAVEPEGASDDDFAALANRYHVARAVVLRRFLDEKRVSAEFYERKAKGWDEQRTKKDAGGNYYATQNVYYSERFLREVYARYTHRLLSKDEAADLIGIAPKNFEKLGDMIQRGAVV